MSTDPGPEYPEWMVWIHGHWRSSGTENGERVWVSGHFRDRRKPHYTNPYTTTQTRRNP